MLRVVAIETSGAGHDLSAEVEGLGWTNVNPGGDETCNFTLKRSWFADNPEIAKGNLLRVMDGIDVLWQGRVEETDRGAEGTETIAVTAYGLGARLKDGTIQEIYVDSDLSQWGPPSRTQLLARLNETPNYQEQGGERDAAPDNINALPGLRLGFSRVVANASVKPNIEGWSGGDITVAQIYYDLARYGLGDANWDLFAYGADDDSSVGTVLSADLAGSDSSGYITVDHKYVGWRLRYIGTFTGDGTWGVVLRELRRYGNHGLTRRGGDPGAFYASDIVSDIVGRVDGIVVRHVDPQTYEIDHLVFLEPTQHESAIAETNKYEGCDWGTWGPDSPLDTSTNGYFDYTDPDRATQHWVAFRAECEDIDLHSELSTLYDTVRVNYTDAAGVRRSVTRTAEVEDLAAAGISGRVLPLEGGVLPHAQAAAALGDTYLALQGGFAPARGSVTIAGPIRHHTRGAISPAYMRADGSNFRIPDVLPARTLFELDADPDRRTTFPIKRVRVDASGPAPRATAELDQSNDLLAVLQARLARDAERLGL